MVVFTHEEGRYEGGATCYIAVSGRHLPRRGQHAFATLKPLRHASRRGNSIHMNLVECCGSALKYGTLP